MRLIYFSVPGRAEASRVALSLAGIDWEDIQVDGPEFQNMKANGELPWGMLPVLVTEEGTLAESSAILRFAGEKAGLVPHDAYQRAKVNEFLDGMWSLAIALDSTFGIDDQQKRIDLRKGLFELEGEGTRCMRIFEEKIRESPTGWIAGSDEMSIADLKLFTELFGLFSGNYDGIEPEMLRGYNQLLDYHSRVSNEPRILKHYSNVSKDDLRWTFLPGAFNHISQDIV